MLGALAGALLGGCAQVLAVDEFNALEPSSQGGAGGTVGTGATCSVATDCAALAKPCYEPLCEAGVCELRLAPEATFCGENSRCDAEGHCLLTRGQPCADATACRTGFCEDGVCCDKACGACSSCVSAPFVGQCLPLESGAFDGVGECMGGRCDGLGNCASGTPSKAFASNVPGVIDRAFAFASRPDGGWILCGDKYAADAQSTDALVLRLSADGAVQSSQSFGAPGSSDGLRGVAVDAAGNGFGVGFCGPGTMLPANPPQACGGAGGSDSIVMKWDPAGNVAWTRVFDASNDVDALSDVALDAAGNPLVVGYTNAPNLIGFRRATIGSLAASGDSNAPILWRKEFSSSLNIAGFSSIAVAPDGDLIVGGSMRGTANFAGISVTSTASTDDAVVIRFDPKAEKARWVRVFGGPNPGDGTFDVAVAPDGTVAVVGHFNYTMSVDKNVTFTGVDAVESFVALLDGTTGSTRWAAPLVGQGETQVRAVAFDPAGNLVFGGFFSGVLGGLGGTLSLLGQEFVASGYHDGFLAKVSPKGVLLWRRTFGGAGADLLYDLIAGAGSVHAAGSSSSSFDFGMTSLTAGDSEGVVLYEFSQ